MAQGRKYSNITSATSTQVKTGRCVLVAIIVNTAVISGTITVVDNTSGSTPAVATITEPGTLLQNHYVIDYNRIEMATGLRIVTTGVQNITVVYEV